MPLVPVLLSIHIITAIAAFGPSFAFPLIARMSAAEPEHGLFALRLTDRIEKRLILPAAATMPISGFLLIYAEGIDLTASSSAWLWIAIPLYLVAMAYSLSFQVRAIDRMIELAGGLTRAQALPDGPGAALAWPMDESAPNVSPAVEMARLAARVRNGGVFLTVLIVVIVSLMAGKPAI